MFGFWRRGAEGKDEAVGPTVSVALIGESYRRSYVRHLLESRAGVEAELASDRRAHMLAEIGPQVVVLDCASEGVNPLLSLPRLAEIAGSPRVVALTDGSTPGGFAAGTLTPLGADATADIRDPQAVIGAILGFTPEPSRGRRCILAAA